MPRIAVWVPEPLLARVTDRFGENANRSGVVQAGLAALLTVTEANPEIHDQAVRLIDQTERIERLEAAVTAIRGTAAGKGARS